MSPFAGIQIITRCLEETQLLGRNIGTSISAGTVICLTGDLGSGKTSFVQGLATGLGVPDDYYITSPTYVLINEYSGRYPLFHIDLYRIEDPVDFEDIGLYEILHGKGVVAVEWADKLSKDFLSEYVTIHFEILNDKSRKITITVDGHDKCNLIEEIKKLYKEIVK
ncbi:MAG TPA: tRNA (adenosine(37)-N6)-threonylcarbamoyltransferase complex ATPase subunit type 1 TsaE [Anaerolineae bacterium]|nr:tRNA (adenosine(37)-N6)-threonylcarbamoyltransferase complex ATPase subunit type 1 TsaE [Anaerolineae bacterium]